MRILFVFDILSHHGGGSQVAVINWIKNLKEHGIKVKLLCNSYAIAHAEGLNDNDIIFIEALNLNFFHKGFSLPIFLTEIIKKEILESKPDIIHLHEPSILAYKITNFAKQNKLKIISSYHTNYSMAKLNNFPQNLLWNPKFGILNRTIHKLQFEILKKSDYLTAPSQVYKEILSSTLGKKVFYVPYPIPEYFFTLSNRHAEFNSASRYTSVQPYGILKPSFTDGYGRAKQFQDDGIHKPTKLITISRLSGEKKIDKLLDMMYFLKYKRHAELVSASPDYKLKPEKQNNNFSLTIIGDGMDKYQLKKNTKNLGLDNVTFLGWVENKKLPEILREHDLFVSMSDYETFGITYIEALASGLPCMVYDYAVSKEIIPHDMGIFMDTDNPKTWAEKLTELQNKPETFTFMLGNIKKDYKKIEQYSEIESTRRLIEIYNTIC